jgi:hypothetical protein
MTIFASIQNLPILLMGIIGLMLLVFLLEQRRNPRESFLSIWNVGAVVLLLVLWGIFSTLLQLLRSFVIPWGSIEELNFRDAMVDVVAYALTLFVAIVLDERRDSDNMHLAQLS